MPEPPCKAVGGLLAFPLRYALAHDMPPPPLPRKKPFVLFLVIGFALLALLSQSLQILKAISAFSEQGATALIGTILIGGLVIAFSGAMLNTLSGNRMRNPALLKVYLWCMLLIFPVTNIAKSFGLYHQSHPTPPELLLLAAAAEIARYLIPIILLVWTANSRSLRDYFATAR